MFRLKYYCPKCKTVLWRWHVKSQSEFRRLYTAVWKMCLKCGNKDDVIPLQEAIENVVTRVQEKKDNDLIKEMYSKLDAIVNSNDNDKSGQMDKILSYYEERIGVR